MSYEYFIFGFLSITILHVCDIICCQECDTQTAVGSEEGSDCIQLKQDVQRVIRPAHRMYRVTVMGMYSSENISWCV